MELRNEVFVVLEDLDNKIPRTDDVIKEALASEEITDPTEEELKVLRTAIYITTQTDIFDIEDGSENSSFIFFYEGELYGKDIERSAYDREFTGEVWKAGSRQITEYYQLPNG